MSESLDLDAIEARASKATEGPWVAEDDGGDQITVGALSYLEDPGFYKSTDLIMENDLVDDTDSPDLDDAQRIADAEFIAHARTDVPTLIARIRELEPRVLEGDWETVRDALDALPEGAQIRWQEGYPLHSFMGMKTTSVFGDTRWSSVGSDGSFDHLSSTGIAHNDSPIEVLA